MSRPRLLRLDLQGARVGLDRPGACRRTSPPTRLRPSRRRRDHHRPPRPRARALPASAFAGAPRSGPGAGSRRAVVRPEVGSRRPPAIATMRPEIAARWRVVSSSYAPGERGGRRSLGSSHSPRIDLEEPRGRELRPPRACSTRRRGRARPRRAGALRPGGQHLAEGVVLPTMRASSASGSAFGAGPACAILSCRSISSRSRARRGFELSVMAARPPSRRRARCRAVAPVHLRPVGEQPRTPAAPSSRRGAAVSASPPER
jgi:hypothetical protein